MDIFQMTAPAVTAPPPANDVTAATAQVNSDFEMFLKMLTAQMRYQDPLNPVDSTDYATQLATFSGVEQAVLTNDLLKSLGAQMSVNGLTDMAAWVGKEARVAAPAYFDGEPITLFPKNTVLADSAEIIVRDATGSEVQRIVIPPTAESAVWAGVGAEGAPMPAGLYSFELISKSNQQVIAQTPVEVYSKVTEVRLEGAQTLLILQGGASVPSGEVTAIRGAAT